MNDKAKIIQLTRSANGMIVATCDITALQDTHVKASYSVEKQGLGYVVVNTATKEVQSFWKQFSIATNVARCLTKAERL